MPSDRQSSNAYPERSGAMGFNSDIKKSLKEQNNPRKGKDTVFPTQVKRSIECKDKLKANYSISPPQCELPRPLRQHAIDGSLVQSKAAGYRPQQSIKVGAKKDDELVKYMSDLPFYLQRVEGEEMLQDKALNVGVLDWTRLEKWMCNEKVNTTSLTSSNLSTNMTVKSSFPDGAPKKTVSRSSEPHPSVCYSDSTCRNDGISRSEKRSQNVIRFRDFETVSKSSMDGREILPWTYKSFSRNNLGVNPKMGERKDFYQKMTSKKEDCSSNLTHHGDLIKPMENISAFCSAATKRVEQMQLSDINIKVEEQMNSSMRDTSSELRNNDVLLNSKEMKSFSNHETEKRIAELQESAVDLSLQCKSGEKRNIVLLFPTKSSQNSSLQARRTSLDKNFTEACQNGLSDNFSHKEVPSSELHCETPHSGPLPSRAPSRMESCKTARNINSVEISSNVSHASKCLQKTPIMLSSSDNVEESHPKARKENAVENSSVLDQKIGELAVTKGRHPSPNRRFSFSLSRMTRSFSSKEGSTFPQFSSSYVPTKSGPVISNSSDCGDISSREKVNAPNRARASPLRRILDPLLKPRGIRQSQAAETDQPLKGSLNSFSFKAIEFHQNEKHGASSVQAVLQFTVRNGVPLFRFVVDNSSSILAATVNHSTSSGKNDSDAHYTFCALDEIKKKSGSWMNQGGKEKSGHCGYAYNVVGQMKVNGASFFDVTSQNSIDQYVMKESVLCGVNLQKADQMSPKFIPNEELAAVVVNMPRENSIIKTTKSDKVEDVKEKAFSHCLQENKCSCNLGKNKYPCSITVIIPGGIHGMPNKGAPSPLIHRWKSGGSCDCGGWDVGCKLHILSNENTRGRILSASKTCLTSDCVELFVQGVAEQDKPAFSLALIEKGTYSIEFSPSISLLQAFFISVTVISCQKLSKLGEASNPPEEKVIQDTGNVNDETKSKYTDLPRKAPVKYSPNPPHSPIGRV